MSGHFDLVGIMDRLSTEERRAVESVRLSFPFMLSEEYAGLIDWSNPADPLRLQVVPSPQELQSYPGESIDPLNEARHMPVPGLIHKYSGRVLWIVTGRCAMHCRFCFRKGYRTGSDMTITDNNNPCSVPAILQFIRDNPDIHEVILSGGDPLTLPRSILNTYIDALSEIETVRLIRIHTRVPVVAWTRDLDVEPICCREKPALRMVIHINHPAEISSGFIECIRRIQRQNIPVLSQSVLLAGVNDSAVVLTRLFLDLVSLRIQPYYLHLLDPAIGTRHFYIPPGKGAELISRIRNILPGYAVPHLVRDIPGAGSKTIFELSP